MSFVINTNVSSLVAQQNLSKSNNMLNQAIERLSSGKRINSAADDAAGQAISNRMTAQINGLTQAKRNANDGISMAQTTEGALDTINNNLQRIRELTVQAANDTNSRSDLSSIQDEIDARLQEIDRVSAQTAFNGVKVLDSNQELKIQVGANDGQTISIDLQEISSTTLGLNKFNVAGDEAATTSDALGELVKNDTVTVTGGTYDGTVFTVQADGSFKADDSGPSGTTGAVLNVNEVEKAIDGNSAAVSSANTSITAITTGGAVTNGTNTLYVDNDGSYIASGAASYEEMTTNPLKALDSALSQVDNLRSNLGALQNRFDSAISNLSTMNTNLTAARSRIVDANYAEVVSQMSKAQILQQAGTSVLAQANQSQQSVLSLLR